MRVEVSPGASSAGNCGCVGAGGRWLWQRNDPGPRRRFDDSVLAGDFGHRADADDADEVEPWLTSELDEPDERVIESGQMGWPLVSCDRRRAAYWADAGLTVVFADRDSSGTCTSTPQLAAWMLDGVAPWFSTEHGTDLASVPGYVTTDAEIRLGSTAEELRAAYPDVEFGEWDIDEYSPSSFHVEGMEGRIDWNPIFDVQVALNEFGAALEVDGIPGPATRQAIAEFQTTRGITESRGEDGIELIGDLGPATLEALGVSPSAAAPVVYLAAGNWAWDFSRPSDDWPKSRSVGREHQVLGSGWGRVGPRARGRDAYSYFETRGDDRLASSAGRCWGCSGPHCLVHVDTIELFLDA